MIFKSWKGLTALSLLTFTATLSGINTLPTPIGGPIQLNPALTFPDPILSNLVEVMDNHYQPPYYPGVYTSPTYLSNIYYLSNAYLATNIIFDPFDNQKVHVTMGQNQTVDLRGIFYPVMVGTNTFATSPDGGLNWSFNPPPEQIIPLGGTISQLINASIGPGLFYEYGKDGTLYASGWGGFDMVSNPPHLDPLSRFLFASSKNNGLEWTPTEVLWPSTADIWFVRSPFYYNRGPSGTESSLIEFYTTVDPSNSQLIHATTSILRIRPLGAPVNVSNSAVVCYMRSEDGGKTFSAPVLTYTLTDDKVWKGQFFNADYGTDPQYLKGTGGILSAAHPVVFDNNVILLPVNIVTPYQGLRSVPGRQSESSTLGVIRSTDGGKTWSESLGFIEEIVPLSQEIYDPGFVNPRIPIKINGQNAFGVFFENAVTYSRDAGGKGTVSESTGRIYFVRPALATNGREGVSRGQFSSLIASSSADKGATWSHYAQVNRTPSDILPGARQAFSVGSALSADGWYAVAYYDFRNWTGFPGELYDNIDPLTAPPLSTDAWLAIYKETEDPLGGSTGIGLDFVGEIRLTPESFNARDVNMGTAVPYITPYITSTPEGISLAFNNNNELYVLYGTQSAGSSDNIDPSSYKGMTVDTNGYFNVFLQRFKFPKPGNQ